MSASVVFPVGNQFKENVNLSARKKNVTNSAKKFGLQHSVGRKPLADKSNTVHTPTTTGKPLKSLQKDSIKKSTSNALGKNVVLNNWSKQNDYLLDTCSYDLDIEDTYPDFWSKWERLSRKDIENIVRPQTPPMLEGPQDILLVPEVSKNEYDLNDNILKPLIIDDVEFPASYADI